MDAKRTGAFIAQLRKEKHYTQKELAQRISVSDKAVSRWETGKGFPETTLLKPLSDALGISIGELLAGERIPVDNIKAQVDEVIVASMKDSKKRINTISAICIGLSALLVICCFAVFIPMLKELSPIKFINSSQTYMLYDLAGEQNGLSYEGYLTKDFENGYEYYLPDGTQRYVFSSVSGYAGHVLSYMHHSGEGMLFGFNIGENTVIKANQTMGVESKSLVQYLKDNGFKLMQEAPAFGRPTLVYINGERCNWFPYTKDNVFINICLSAQEGRRLIAYDIGLIDSSLNAFFERMQTGFPVILEDPYHLVTNELREYYSQWEDITITVKDDKSMDTLYLYINGQLIEKFNDSITFEMRGAPIRVHVTPEQIGDKAPQ